MAFYILTTPDRDNYQYKIGTTTKQADELLRFSDLIHPFFKLFVECKNYTEVKLHIRNTFYEDIDTEEWYNTNFQDLYKAVSEKIIFEQETDSSYPGIIRPQKFDTMRKEFFWIRYDQALYNFNDESDKELYKDYVDQDICNPIYLQKVLKKIKSISNYFIVGINNKQIVLGYNYDECNNCYHLQPFEEIKSTTIEVSLDGFILKPYIKQQLAACAMSMLKDHFLIDHTAYDSFKDPDRQGWTDSDFYTKHRKDDVIRSLNPILDEEEMWNLIAMSNEEQILRMIVPSFMKEADGKFENLHIAESYNSYDCDLDTEADSNVYYLFCYCNLYANNASNLLKALKLMKNKYYMKFFNEITLHKLKYDSTINTLKNKKYVLFQNELKLKKKKGASVYDTHLNHDQLLDVIKNLKPRHWQKKSSFMYEDLFTYTLFGDGLMINEEKFVDQKLNEVGYHNPFKKTDVYGSFSDHCILKIYKPKIYVWRYDFS